MDLNSKYIKIENLSLNFPVLDNTNKSIRHQLVKNPLKSYKNKPKIFNALNEISFSLESGDKLAVIGDNGAGKTTLLRLLSGVYEPSEGFIDINGETISFIDLTMGMNIEATGRENILIRGIMHGLSIKKIKKLEDQIIDFSGLSEFIDRPIRTYSSGMLLRLGFSIVTSIKSDIIIMDEWLSTGDEKFQKKAEIKLKEIIDNSHILILATHSKNLVNKLCNKVLELDHGTIKKFSSIT